MIFTALWVSGCAATTTQIIPTDRPTAAPTDTATPSNTPGADATLTAVARIASAQPTAGPSPTSIFGPTRTPEPGQATATPPPDPNAPGIEFFTTSADEVEPGGSLVLFWSTRNADRAVIYRLDRAGERQEVFNVDQDGNLTYTTSIRDRGQVDFVLLVGTDDQEVQQRLSVPLGCPIEWFFNPRPDECAEAEANETLIKEQTFERGRMVYIADEEAVYVLFNDGNAPAWTEFENQYDPAVDPESVDNFPSAPGTFQPIAELGFVWRGDDTTRNRLGLGTTELVEYLGFVQTSTLDGGGTARYISSIGQVVLQLLPRGGQWQIITVP